MLVRFSGGVDRLYIVSCRNFQGHVPSQMTEGCCRSCAYSHDWNLRRGSMQAAASVFATHKCSASYQPPALDVLSQRMCRVGPEIDQTPGSARCTAPCIGSMLPCSIMLLMGMNFSERSLATEGHASRCGKRMCCQKTIANDWP